MSEAAPRRSDDARARLLHAAIQAFGAKGFHGTTTRDIAQAAGMSPAGMYAHHKSKEELLFIISKDGHENTVRLLEMARLASSDPVDQLRGIMFQLAVDHARKALSSRIVNYELEALVPEHGEEIRVLRRRIDSAVRDVVARGVDEGVFSVDDVHMMATALLSLIIDISRWFRPDAKWTPEDVGRRYAALALRMVGARSG